MTTPNNIESMEREIKTILSKNLYDGQNDKVWEEMIEESSNDILAVVSLAIQQRDEKWCKLLQAYPKVLTQLQGEITLKNILDKKE